MKEVAREHPATMPLLGYTTWLVMPWEVMALGPAYAAKAALISPEGKPTAAASLANFLLSMPFPTP